MERSEKPEVPRELGKRGVMNSWKRRKSEEKSQEEE